jgi:uncharacterized protein
MEFEWDEEKRRQTYRTRGVDFANAIRIFNGPVVQFEDDRREYGETRLVSIGFAGDECYVVVHTRRDDRIRIITAWIGGKDDRARYQKGHARRNKPDA